MADLPQQQPENHDEQGARRDARGDARAGVEEPTCEFGGGAEATQLVEVLEGYLADLKAGRAVDKAELLAAHPDLAQQLEACLAGIEFIHRSGAQGVEPPRQLGEFRILREIGRGGMGAVYEAEQESLGRRVALKVLRFGTVSDPEALERFRREAETVANLHHTNIVPIFSVGEEGGVSYYAMQFIEGSSLADVVAAGEPVDLHQAAGWVLQAAEALAHAHARDVVHRDVKPSNLLLDREGRIWLTDFGLAKRLDDVTLSMTGVLMGTPRYMSPEQATIEARRIDHRTDIYSLGATLYELATGQPVFAAETPHGVIQQILAEEPQPPHKLRADVPRDLETIILKCLSKEAAARYESAEELAADLRAFLEDRPVSARRPSLVELGARWLRRQKRSVALTFGAAGGALLLAAACLAAWYAWHRSRIATLSLDADEPPLVAELLDADNTAARAALTVPTQQPIEVTEGSYRLRYSAEGRLSQDYGLNLTRGRQTELHLSLKDPLIGDAANPTIDVARRFRVVKFAAGAEPLLLDEDGISRTGLLGRPGWNLPLREDQRPRAVAEAAPGLVWSWQKLNLYNPDHGAFDISPLVLPESVDFNGDGEGDVLLAARHQAWLMAVSGRDGSMLWTAARAADVTAAPHDLKKRERQGVLSAALGMPQVLPDLDGDGVPEILATLGDAADAMRSADAAPRRWVEVLSGATGNTIEASAVDGKLPWRFDLPPELFALPQGTEVPHDYRWFVGTGGGYSGGGGGGMNQRFGRYIRTQRYQVERHGRHYAKPSEPRVVSLKDRSVVAIVAGSRLLLLDYASGQPLAEPSDLGVVAGLQPVFADVDGGPTAEVVLLHHRQSNRKADAAQVAVWSIEKQSLLWKKNLAAYWPQRPDWTIPAPRWPLVEDLDGDGRCEVLVPDGGNVQHGNVIVMPDLNWGFVAALEGDSGQVRWRQRVVSMDDAIEHFAVGPDINGDGHREVFTASLFGVDFQLYVDCLSGRDGSLLWFASHSLRRQPDDPNDYWPGTPAWWDAGDDGWPQLVVPVHSRQARGDDQLCLFSAAGAFTRFGVGIHQTLTADVNGDGVDDLLTFRRKKPGGAVGGALEIVRGVAAEPWRRLAPPTQAAADFDGDEVIDLLETHGNRLAAISGRSGQPLWQTELQQMIEPQVKPVGDLDGDGARDLLACARRSGAGAHEYYPLQAVSGRDGRLLWRADVSVCVIEYVQAVDARDLDGDGLLEVVFVAATDWAYPRARRSYGTNQVQLWAAVFSGRDGSLRWKEPLSPDYRAVPPPQVALDDVSLEVAYSDLDGDGVLDLLLPAVQPAAGPSAIHLQAFNGATGNVLWRHPVPPSGSPQDALRELPPLRVADLDGDSNPEVLLRFATEPQGGAARRIAWLRCLRGATGEQLWQWQADIPAYGDRVRRLLPDAVVLREGDGSRLICLNLHERAADHIVVLAADGQERARHEVNRKTGPRPGCGLWVCDVEGDGVDELLFSDNQFLAAARPQDLADPLWTRKFAAPLEREAVQFSRDGTRPGRIIVQGGGPAAPEHGLVALDPATGETAWTCAAPRPATGPASSSPLHAAVLSAVGDADAPLVHLQYGDVSLCRQAAQPGADRAQYALRVTPVTQAGDDPRLMRPLPWAMEDYEAAQLPAFAAWSALYAICLLIIPVWYVAYVVHRRTWGLKTLLVAPVVAALFISVWLIDPPDSNAFLGSWTKIVYAVLATPPLLLPGMLVRWVAKRRWWSVGIWLALLLAVCATIATVSLLTANPLLEGEYYGSQGAYAILFSGGVATSWILLFWLPLAAAGRYALRRARGQ